MANDSDRSWRVRGVSRTAGARGRLRHWFEAVDGDVAFRVVVVTAGMLSTVAIAFGLLSS